jgi:hypothetical protein
VAWSQGSGQVQYKLQCLYTISTCISTMSVTGPILTGLRGTKITSSSSYTLVTGSNGTFIDSKFAICTDIPLSSACKLVVLAANGQEMLSTSQCKGCSFNIQGKDFTTDFRAIFLKG